LLFHHRIGSEHFSVPEERYAAISSASASTFDTLLVIKSDLSTTGQTRVTGLNIWDPDPDPAQTDLDLARSTPTHADPYPQWYCKPPAPQWHFEPCTSDWHHVECRLPFILFFAEPCCLGVHSNPFLFTFQLLFRLFSVYFAPRNLVFLAFWPSWMSDWKRGTKNHGSIVPSSGMK
jgi:hypothetical protein